MLHYILQTVIFQLLFLMVYDVFLKNETFFNWNRFYLLISAFLSIVLPFVKVENFKEVIPKQYIFKLPEVIIGASENTTQTIQDGVGLQNASEIVFSWHYVLYLGCVIAFVFFLIKLSKILILAANNPKVALKNVLIIKLLNSKAAFSFFKYVFIGDAIIDEEKESIIAHEIIHVKEKHSLDLLFFEALKIFFWFNPLVYMYQKRIAHLHEFIADAKAIQSRDRTSYYRSLLAQVFDSEKATFINPFFKQSLIKKRIVMLSKSKSKHINLVKYVLLIPMVIGMLFYTSCESQIENNEKNQSNNVSEASLIAKYTQILKEEEKNGQERLFEIFTTLNNNYLNTKEEYVKFKVYTNHLAKISLDKAFDDDDEYNIRMAKKMLEKTNTTYEEYLKRKETQKFKDQWENGSTDGQLRLLVDDLNAISAEEQKLKDSKLTQIENDKWYHTLIISDGLRHEKIEIREEVKQVKEHEFNDAISFAEIDQVPIHPECENLINNLDLRNCFSQSINKFVVKNFNIKVAKQLDLKGRQKINAFFTIDESGIIKNIKVRAAHPKLEEETKRVISLLPKVIPGKLQDGKPVDVTFFLPIKFNVK